MEAYNWKLAAGFYAPHANGRMNGLPMSCDIPDQSSTRANSNLAPSYRIGDALGFSRYEVNESIIRYLSIFRIVAPK
jgi:hypothetical protein